MKKFLCYVLIVLLVCLIACNNNSSFREGITCEDILTTIIDATKHPDADKIYKKTENNLDSNSFSLWVDGIFQESEEFEFISDYAIFVSAGTTTYEVAVLKTDSCNSVELIKELYERRKETLSLGDKGMYDPEFETRLSNSKIKIVGEFALLIITDDNDAALDAIEKLK